MVKEITFFGIALIMAACSQSKELKEVKEFSGLKVVENDTLRTVYYEEDVPATISQLKNGIKNGKETGYYLDGSVMNYASFKNDTLNGEFLQFHRNGKLKFKGNYRNGHQVDTCKWFYQNGNLKEWKLFNGDGTLGGYTEFDSLGKVVDENLRVIYSKPKQVDNNQFSMRIELDNIIYKNIEVIIGKLDGKKDLSDTFKVLRSKGDYVDYKFQPARNQVDTLEAVIHAVKNTDGKKSTVWVYHEFLVE